MCHSAEKRRSGGTDGDWISGKRKNHQCERIRKDFIRFPAGMHQKDNVSKIIPERRVRAGGRSSHRSELYPGRTEKKRSGGICSQWSGSSEKIRSFHAADEGCRFFCVAKIHGSDDGTATSWNYQRNGDQKRNYSDRRGWISWKVHTVKGIGVRGI